MTGTRRADEIHLPSLRELILGSPFLSNDIDKEAQAWAERVTPRLDRSTIPGQLVTSVLEALTVSPTLPDFQTAIDAPGTG